MAENFQNFYVTKLREACDASATTIYVETIPTITEGTLVIEYANSTKREIIHFTGRSGYSLTGCTRGYENTTAQSHSAGVDVRQNVTAGMLDKITNRAITTENIADGAVTAAKIDFDTLGNAGNTNTSAITHTSSTPTDRLSVSLPAGTYAILVFCNFWNGSTSASGECYVRIKYGSTTSNSVKGYLSSSQYSSTDAIGAYIVTLTETTTVYLQTSVGYPSRGTYTTSPNGCGIIVTRLS